MDLWKELLISGLQNESYEFKAMDYNVLKEILEDKIYQVLLQIKQIINDEKLSNEDCFVKIKEIMSKLEENGIFCNRSYFG